MVKVSSILGLNARTQIYSYPYNTTAGKSVATSKLKTKRVLGKAGIHVPERYAVFTKPQKILDFDWSKLPSAFALKPNKGLGGEGIIIVKKRAKDSTPEKPVWIASDKRRVTADDMKLQVLDILEGAYSLGNVPDFAYIEEYVGRHKAFKRYAFRGTPDIRVIVFNKVPVMAMMRLPTKESGGRANLHQGAIAVGIDIVTGITTRAYWKGEYIRFKPGTKRKLHGIKIPKWDSVLKLAVECQEVAGLGYMGADIVFHPKKGPMVLELNYQPGLQIQIVNMAGLKKRLERVEDMTVKDAEHGVKIAKALFAASFSDRVRAEVGVKTVSAIEEVKIKGAGKKQRRRVFAKVDTGAWRTSISSKLAKELGLLEERNILWSKKVKSSLGLEERPIISLTFWLAGRKITTPASVAKRLTLKYPIIIGRKNLKGFLIDPDIVEKLKEIKK